MLPVSVYAHTACVLEVTARKVGDVNRLHDLPHATLADFLLGAAAIAPVFDDAPSQGVGRTILEAVRRMRQVTQANTHLGVILLLAPLAAVPADVRLEDGIERVLAGLTVEDARLAYEAIRLARPGGLGTVAEQDIAQEPTVTLREAMRLAADRDTIARQYVNGFEDVCRTGRVALATAMFLDWPLEEAVVLCQLTLLSRFEDSLIARLHGHFVATLASESARAILENGWPHRPEAQQRLRELDQWMRHPLPQRNPGTTADLVTASLFVALRDGVISLPLKHPWKSERIE